MTTPEPASPRQRAAGLGFLALAAVVAAGVALYLFLSGDGSGSDPLSGTAISQLPGAPTPFPNTGVLQPQRPKEGEPAPDFALVDVRDSGLVRKLSDFRGKAVVLNWYASWCVPCKTEIPEFQKASEALATEVVFLGIDYLESRDKALGILDSLAATYPAVLDNNGAVAEHYRVGQGGGGLPTTFFVDKDGILRGMKTGQVSKDQLVDYLAKAGVTYKP
jgi:cytochrome c biogenesis protein CcmG/thiol:disulfide interchange protein DsbE